MAIGIFFLCTLPYAIYMEIWNRPDVSSYVPWYLRKWRLLGWYLRDLSYVAFFPWPFLIGGLIAFRWCRHHDQKLYKTGLEWGLLGVGNIVWLALLSPQSTGQPALSDVRYFIISVPFLMGVIAVVLWTVHQSHRIVGRLVAILILGVFVTSNGMTWVLSSWHPWGWGF